MQQKQWQQLNFNFVVYKVSKTHKTKTNWTHPSLSLIGLLWCAMIRKVNISQASLTKSVIFINQTITMQKQISHAY